MPQGSLGVIHSLIHLQGAQGLKVSPETLLGRRRQKEMAGPPSPHLPSSICVQGSLQDCAAKYGGKGGGLTQFPSSHVLWRPSLCLPCLALFPGFLSAQVLPARKPLQLQHCQAWPFPAIFPIAGSSQLSEDLPKGLLGVWKTGWEGKGEYQKVNSKKPKQQKQQRHNQKTKLKQKSKTKKINWGKKKRQGDKK